MFTLLFNYCWAGQAEIFHWPTINVGKNVHSETPCKMINVFFFFFQAVAVETVGKVKPMTSCLLSNIMYLDPVQVLLGNNDIVKARG